MFKQEGLEKLLQWKKACDENSPKQKLNLLIGVDIGGTNCRIAVGLKLNENLPNLAKENEYINLAKFEANSAKILVPAFEEIEKQLLSTLGNTIGTCYSCLDAAGPITEFGSCVVITNYPGSIEDQTITKLDLPQKIFPKDTTIFVNDLESASNGIHLLHQTGKLPNYFKMLFGKEISLLGHTLVLAMGTGLGVSVLLKLGNSDYQVLPLEYGHTSVNCVGPNQENSQLDQELQNFISQKLYDGKKSIEYEDICSGRGLSNCYEFLIRNEKDKRLLLPEEIANKAQEGDELCLEAMKIHYTYLMRVAKNMTVGLQIKTIILAGDNQVTNFNFVEKHAKILNEEFSHHTKSEWLDVPVLVQTKLFNINLSGCIFVASSM